MTKIRKQKQLIAGASVAFAMVSLWILTVAGSLGSAALPLAGQGLVTRQAHLTRESLEVPVASSPTLVLAVDAVDVMVGQTYELILEPATAPNPRVMADDVVAAPAVAAANADGGGESMNLSNASVRLKQILALNDLG